MATIKDRVLKIAEHYGISKELFFHELGLSYANFKGVQKKSALNSDSISKILSKYPDISYNWLLTGEGQMLKEKDSSVEAMDYRWMIEYLKKELEDKRHDYDVLREELNDIREILRTISDGSKKKESDPDIQA